jgi:hypothetical protein
MTVRCVAGLVMSHARRQALDPVAAFLASPTQSYTNKNIRQLILAGVYEVCLPQ